MSNLILKTDSYKASQWKQYPKGTKKISSYIEPRKSSIDGVKEVVFFGLQAFIKEYLSRPITLQNIEEAKDFIIPHGEPFNKEGWLRLLEKHHGWLPLKIEAVPEGMPVPVGNVQLQIVNTDPEFYWLTSYVETALLRAIWYPSTIATLSRRGKQFIGTALSITSDIPVQDQIGFKLHDFGARGVSSSESAMLGGMGHLVNFMGTDTMEALIGARKYYNENMAGFSIPASEHSTMTSWSRENETDAYNNMLELFSGEGKILACVSDSYDIYNAARNIWGGELLEKVKNSGGTLVIRPDSGNPIVVPIKVIEILMEKFGFTTNSKGYKVLPDCVRVIQGDGITIETLPKILSNMEQRGLSADNIAFGMGGGLLQHVNRDTFGYAMKASARQDETGEWHDVYKDPIGGSKTSKKGRLGLIHQHGVGSDGLFTVPKHIADTKGNLLRTVYRDGELLIEDSFADIRKRADITSWKPEQKEPISRYE
jgi:nicotinamide phosphoribosyltransferase